MSANQASPLFDLRNEHSTWLHHFAQTPSGRRRFRCHPSFCRSALPDTVDGREDRSEERMTEKPASPLFVSLVVYVRWTLAALTEPTNLRSSDSVRDVVDEVRESDARCRRSWRCRVCGAVLTDVGRIFRNRQMESARRTTRYRAC